MKYIKGGVANKHVPHTTVFDYNQGCMKIEFLNEKDCS
jgi:hypothetical protein